MLARKLQKRAWLRRLGVQGLAATSVLGCLRSAEPIPIAPPPPVSPVETHAPLTLESLRVACESGNARGGLDAGRGPAFDRIAARASIDAATDRARKCGRVSPEGPIGGGQVQLVYAASGQVQSTRMLSTRFEHTKTGDCVLAVFLDACIPPYAGELVYVNKGFTIER